MPNDVNEPAPQRAWTSTQAYGMAVICLLLGIGTGYLVHGPSQVASAKPAIRRDVPASPAGEMQVTPEQMKHMADKKAEPLLAQLQKHPNDAGLLTEIGKGYFYGRQFPLAAEYYERAAKIKADAETFTSLAAIYHFGGDDNRAIDSLNRALQIDPRFAPALFNLGKLKWQSQSDPKAAIAAWEKLLQAHPNYPKRADVEAMIAQAKRHMTMASAENADKSSK